MSTGISMDDKPLDPASRKLAKKQKWEMENLGYINGVHRDYGDDIADFDAKYSCKIEEEFWFPIYFR